MQYPRAALNLPISFRPLNIEPLLALTIVWNLVDLIATVFVVEAGLAIEANPLMDLALRVGVVPFALIKLSLVSLGVYFLWCHRERHLSVLGAVAIFFVYSLVVAYHGNQLGFLVGEVGSAQLLFHHLS